MFEAMTVIWSTVQIDVTNLRDDLVCGFVQATIEIVSKGAIRPTIASVISHIYRRAHKRHPFVKLRAYTRVSCARPIYVLYMFHMHAALSFMLIVYACL